MPGRQSSGHQADNLADIQHGQSNDIRQKIQHTSRKKSVGQSGGYPAQTIWQIYGRIVPLFAGYHRIFHAGLSVPDCLRRIVYAGLSVLAMRQIFPWLSTECPPDCLQSFWQIKIWKSGIWKRDRTWTGQGRDWDRTGNDWNSSSV